MKKSPGWIFRDRHDRRAAFKKRQRAAVIDRMVAAELKRLSELSGVPGTLDSQRAHE
jgi:hypothetical protein